MPQIVSEDINLLLFEDNSLITAEVGVFPLAYYRYTQDIVFAALEAARESPTTSSEYYTMALQFLNRVYRELWNGGSAYAPDINEDWRWLRASNPSVIITKAIYTGFAKVTNGSNIVQLSNINTSLLGSYFQTTGDGIVYIVIEHNIAEGVMLLDSNYIGSSQDNVPFTVHFLRYPLPELFKEFIGPLRVSGQVKEIHEVSQLDMDRYYPIGQIANVPEKFCRTQQNEIRFSTGFKNPIRIEFDYIELQSDLLGSDLEEPKVPIQWRHILVDLVTYHLLLDKEDSIAQAYLKSGINTLIAMAKENREESSRTSTIGRVYARRNSPRGGRTLITEGGLIVR